MIHTQDELTEQEAFGDPGYSELVVGVESPSEGIRIDEEVAKASSLHG